MDRGSSASNKVGWQLREKYIGGEMIAKRSSSMPRRGSSVLS